MSIVARGLLGAPASAVVLKGGFGDVRKLVNRQRWSSDAGYVEMIMYLRGAHDYIPEIIT